MKTTAVHQMSVINNSKYKLIYFTLYFKPYHNTILKRQ